MTAFESYVSANRLHAYIARGGRMPVLARVCWAHRFPTGFPTLLGCSAIIIRAWLGRTEMKDSWRPRIKLPSKSKRVSLSGARGSMGSETVCVRVAVHCINRVI